MKNLYRAKICIVLLLSIFSIEKTLAGYEVLLHKTYAERFDIIDSLFYYNQFLDHDSAFVFQKLETVRKMAEQSGDKELVLEAGLVRAAYYITGLQKNDPAVEPLLFKIIKDAQQQQNKQIELRARQFLGRYYIELHSKYGPALDHYLRSYYLLNELSLREFPNKQEHIYNIATAYYNFGDYDNTKKYLLEAERVGMPESSNLYKIPIFINMTNTLGLIYRKEGRFDSAEYYFRAAYNMAERAGVHTWMGITSGNIGIVYLMQKRYTEAIPLLQKDVRECFKVGEIDNGVNSLIKLAEISFVLNNTNLAKAQALQARDSIYRTRDPFRHKQSLFPLLAKLYKAENNMALAYAYADSARIITDTMTARLNAIALARSEQKLAAGKYRSDIALVNSQKNLQHIILNALVVCVILLIVIALLFINRQRLKHLQERREMYTKNRMAEAELALATEQLTRFTNNLHEKNRLIEKFTAEIEKLQQPDSSQSISENNNEILQELQQSTILTEEQWEEFRRMFDKVHNGYIDRLKEKLPTLSPAEIRFMVLNKLKLSNKEMAGVLGVGPEAIRQYRHRLRKKLPLSEDDSIQDFADII